MAKRTANRRTVDALIRDLNARFAGKAVFALDETGQDFPGKFQFTINARLRAGADDRDLHGFLVDTRHKFTNVGFALTWDLPTET